MSEISKSRTSLIMSDGNISETMQNEDGMLNTTRKSLGIEVCRSKRLRNDSQELEDDDGFVTINRRPKRLLRSYSKNSDTVNQSQKHNTPLENRFEVCITSKNPLPKQIAMAKLLRRFDMQNIERIKYKSTYKVLILFGSKENADQLINCKEITDLGLNCQMTFESNLAYGIVKQMDLEIDIKELEENIKSDTPVISVRRLKRLSNEGVWVESETVRLCFKSDTLPPYVFGYGTRFKVEPYIFPVTQCSGCWRFGHSKKFCPTNKILCPKCGNNHINCETKQYRCLNCKGPHMSLDKMCPVFKKEKEIRQLMSKHNHTYRKALLIYDELFKEREQIIDDENIQQEWLNSQPRARSYRDVLVDIPTCQSQDIDSTSEESNSVILNNHNNNPKKINSKRRKKQKKLNVNNDDSLLVQERSQLEENQEENQRAEHSQERRNRNTERSFSFHRMLQQIKEIIMSDVGFEDKIKEICEMLFKKICKYVMSMIKNVDFITNIISNLSNG